MFLLLCVQGVGSWFTFTEVRIGFSGWRAELHRQTSIWQSIYALIFSECVCRREGLEHDDVVRAVVSLFSSSTFYYKSLGFWVGVFSSFLVFITLRHHLIPLFFYSFLENKQKTLYLSTGASAIHHLEALP